MVSSALISILNRLLARGRSFIYVINKSGARIEPCGTPVDMCAVLEIVSFKSANCLRLSYKFEKNLTGWRVYCSVLISRFNLSNASDRSRNKPNGSSSLFLCDSTDQLYCS